jgi:hypothetical protein
MTKFHIKAERREAYNRYGEKHSKADINETDTNVLFNNSNSSTSLTFHFFSGNRSVPNLATNIMSTKSIEHRFPVLQTPLNILEKLNLSSPQLLIIQVPYLIGLSEHLYFQHRAHLA